MCSVGWCVGGLSCGPGVYVSLTVSGLGVGFGAVDRFGPSSGVFY